MKKIFRPVVALGLAVLAAVFGLGLQGKHREEVIVFALAAVAAGAALSLFLWRNRREFDGLLAARSGKRAIGLAMQILFGRRVARRWGRDE